MLNGLPQKLHSNSYNGLTPSTDNRDMNTVAKKFVCIMVVVTMIAACATMNTTPIDPAPHVIQHIIKLGDKVQITKVTGELLTFRVEEIGDSHIGGEGEKVRYSNISEIDRIQVDRAHSTRIVLTVVGIALLVILIIAGLQLESEFGS